MGLDLGEGAGVGEERCVALKNDRKTLSGARPHPFSAAILTSVGGEDHDNHTGSS